LQFLDRENKIIVKLGGEEEGIWTKIELVEGEEIIGFQSRQTDL